MKKKLFVFLVLFLFLFTGKVNALCNDEELNNWANRVKIERKEYRNSGFTDKDGKYVWTGSLGYAYFFAPNIKRTDIYMVATNNVDDEEQQSEYFPGYDTVGIGGYNNLDEVKFTINVYGSEESACPDELLKTEKITVPPLNRYVTSEFCDKYPEHENCASYKDTSKITQEEFVKEAEKYTKDHSDDENEKSFIQKVLDSLLEFGPFVVIPFIVISIYYSIKIKKFKKAEMEK